MIKVNPRRPFDDEQPDGYVESDKDFVLNNIEAAVELLERELAAQQSVQRTGLRVGNGQTVLQGEAVIFRPRSIGHFQLWVCGGCCR